MRIITIKGGTPLHTESLCRTCYWAHIQRGFRESEELMHCCFSRFRQIPFAVAECTDYCDKTVPSREDMERIALRIDPSRARRAAGFASIGITGSGEATSDSEDTDGDAQVESKSDSIGAHENICEEAEPSPQESEDAKLVPAK